MDGRGCEDYRCVEVETDVVSNTSGSARVKLVSSVATVGAEVEQWVGPGGPAAGPSRLWEHKGSGGNPRPKANAGRGAVQI